MGGEASRGKWWVCWVGWGVLEVFLCAGAGFGEVGVVVADVVLFAECCGGEDEADGAWGEIAEVVPVHGAEVEAAMGVVEAEGGGLVL